MTERRLIGIRELSEYLGVSKNTVYSWVYHDKIPYSKVGRLLRFDLSKIDLWIDEETDRRKSHSN